MFTHIFESIVDFWHNAVTPCEFARRLNPVPAGVVRLSLRELERGDLGGLLFRNVVATQLLGEVNDVYILLPRTHVVVNVCKMTW